MNIFASYKGKFALKVFFLLIGVAFVSMVFNGGEGTPVDDSTNVAGEQAPQINYARVYAEPEEEKEPTEEETEEPVDQDQAIINAAQEPVDALLESWVNYDFNSPPAKGSLTGFPQDPLNQTNMNPRYDAWVKGMQDKKELSTGQVTNIRLESIKYTGTPEVGNGTAIFIVSTTSTVANNEVGSGGTTLNKQFKVTAVRLADTTTEENDEWFVSNIEPLS